MTRNYSALRERMETRTLANGLRICYLPKEGFSKTFAILAADFGSVDASFTLEGRRYDTPEMCIRDRGWTMRCRLRRGPC